MLRLPDTRNRFDHVINAASMLCTMILVAGFLWLLSAISINGFGAISWEFIFNDPLDAGRKGGIWPVIISTLAVLAVCLAVTIPLGLICAFLLAESSQQHVGITKYLSKSLDVLASVPSIVFGLFGNAFFCVLLGMGYSILSGGLTLACMVLPLMIRLSEQSLRAIPQHYRLHASSLGLSKTTESARILLPIALPGITIAVVISTGRALAETAALLYTAGYVTRMPESLMDSGRVISLHIYDLALNVPGGSEHGYGTALILILLIFMLNGLLLGISNRLYAGQQFTRSQR